ncbi:MAG: hypothetical protein NZ518_06435, partial [Dehalococcoidia bacterium]|nr:hypothetical protein [Dehalococcoidia bacterium]
YFDWLATVQDADSVERLRATVAQAQRDGFLLARADRAPEFIAASVPVMGRTGAIAALSVVGPASRWTMERAADHLPTLRAAADAIARASGAV